MSDQHDPTTRATPVGVRRHPEPAAGLRCAVRLCIARGDLRAARCYMQNHPLGIDWAVERDLLAAAEAETRRLAA